MLLHTPSVLLSGDRLLPIRKLSKEAKMVNFDFKAAKVKHTTWRALLRKFLDGQATLTEAEATSERDCELGKWLYAEGLQKYSNIPEMASLESIHKTLHATVRTVIVARNSGDTEAAEVEFNKIAGISDEIISLLDKLDALTSDKAA